MLDEGIATGRALSQVSPRGWWAVQMAGGDTIMQYGRERHPLAQWAVQMAEGGEHATPHTASVVTRVATWSSTGH